MFLPAKARWGLFVSTSLFVCVRAYSVKNASRFQHVAIEPVSYGHDIDVVPFPGRPAGALGASNGQSSPSVGVMDLVHLPQIICGPNPEQPRSTSILPVNARGF